MEIDHVILSTVILSPADVKRAVLSFWRENVHKRWLTP